MVGSILGDGSLLVGTRNSQLRIAQSIKHKSYVEWLREELQPFVSRPVHLGTIELKTTGKDYGYAQFSPVYYSEFTRFRDLFYPDDKKIVPVDIDDYLDELALAVWFMDDGYTGRFNSTLCTQGFTESECCFLLDVLQSRFGIVGRVNMMKQNGNRYPTLLFQTKTGGHKRLHEIVDPLLHKDFEYKKLRTGPGHARGERQHNSKLSGDSVRKIRRLAAEGVLQRVLAKRFDVGISQVNSVIHRKTWKHIA